MYISKYNIYLLFYLLISIPGFYLLGITSLEGTIDIQTYSDSLTYENIAKNLYDEISLVTASSNLLGPVELLRFLDYNYELIYCFNIIILISSIKLILKYYRLNINVFLFFLLMTPLTYFSLFNVNKEILLYLSMAIFLIFLRNKNILIFLLTVILAFFVRWQLSLFFLIAFILLSIGKTKKRRIILLMLMTFSLSIIYPIMVNGIFKDIVFHSDNSTAELVQGSGIFTLLNEIQKHIGGYMVVVIPKIMQINFGLVKRIMMIGDPIDFWNYFVLLLHSVFSLILVFYGLYKKRFNLNNDLIYLALIYGIMFAVTPIINIRYFLPMYIFLLVAFTTKKKRGVTIFL